MATIPQQIIERVKAALLGATPAGNSVDRDRTVPITREETPLIVVRRVREQKDPFSRAGDNAIFTANVCIHARGDLWADIADPIAVAVHKTLCNDKPLAQLVTSVRNSGAEWEDHDVDEGAGCLTLEYQFRYTVRATDLTNSIII